MLEALQASWKHPQPKANVFRLPESLEEGGVSEERYIDLTSEHAIDQPIIKGEPGQTPSSNIGMDFCDSPSPEGLKTPLNSRGTFLNELMRADL